MLDACVREIEELHAFFQAWFAGELANTGANFGRFSSVTHADFTIIGPNGQVTDRATIVDVLRQAHGAGAFEIWVENATVQSMGADHYLALYEEWQIRDGTKTSRQSSAIFVADEGTPNGVAWRHVHETWVNSAAA